MTKNIRDTLLRLFVSFGAIGAIVYFMRDKIGESMSILQHEVIWLLFFLGAFIYFTGIILQSIRLLYIFKTHEIHLKFREAIYLSFLGLFFNLFFPSAVGGDIAKAFFASKFTGKKLESASAVLQDRLVGFVTMITLAILAVMFAGKQLDNPQINKLILVFLAVMIFTVVFLFSKRVARRFKFMHVFIPSESIRGKLNDLYHSIYGFKRHPMILVTTLALSAVAQLCFIFVHYIVTRSMVSDVDILIFFLLVPVIAIVSMAPSLGGLGVREAGVIFLLKDHITSERAMALSLLLFIIIYAFSLGAGIIYAFKGGLKQKTFEEMEALET